MLKAERPKLTWLHCTDVDRDSSVGIATRYGMDGPVIESRWWGSILLTSVQNGPGANPACCTIGTVSLYQGKVPEAWRRPPAPSGAEIKERVKSYL